MPRKYTLCGKYVLVIRRRPNNLNFCKGSFQRSFMWMRDQQECGADWIMWCWLDHVVLAGSCGADWIMWCWLDHVVLTGSCGADWTMWWWLDHVGLTRSCGADWIMWCWLDHVEMTGSCGADWIMWSWLDLLLKWAEGEGKRRAKAV